MSKRAITVTIDEEIYNDIVEIQDGKKLSPVVEDLLRVGLSSYKNNSKDVFRQLLFIVKGLNTHYKDGKIVFKED